MINLSAEDSTAKKLMWKFLLKKGQVIRSKSYYGNSYSEAQTGELHDKIRVSHVDVDWGKTKEVEEGLEGLFQGTFHDNPEIKYMEGEIVFKDGDKFSVHWNPEESGEPLTYTQVINEILKEA